MALTSGRYSADTTVVLGVGKGVSVDSIEKVTSKHGYMQGFHEDTNLQRMRGVGQEGQYKSKKAPCVGPGRLSE